MHPDPEPPSELSSDAKQSRCSLLRSEDTLPVVKFVIILVLAVALCSIGILSPNDILRSRRQFKSWYSQYAYQLNIIAQNNCTNAYSVYLYGTRHNTSDETPSGADQRTLFVEPMINCLLENASEYIKYQLSSSQVIHGLTPTIIALLGTSSEEVCLLALIGRRRLLGFLLATASPSIYTERAFKYQDPDRILKERLHKSHVKPTMHSNVRWFFVLLEYIAVLSCVTNIVTLNWELGVKSINGVNANTVLMPMLWSFLGVTAHLGGAVVFNLRARRLDKQNTPMQRSTLSSYLGSLNALKRQGLRSAISKMFTACKEMAVREVCWGANEEKEELYFVLIPENRCFTFLAWFLSVLVVFHIILGTIILSSTNLVGPRDALGILMRYILSVITCRVIVIYELAVLRVGYQNTNISEITDDQE